MSTLRLIENKPVLELDLKDCELLLEAIEPLIKRNKGSYEVLLCLRDDGALSPKKQKQMDDKKKAFVALGIIRNHIIEIGNKL